MKKPRFKIDQIVEHTSLPITIIGKIVSIVLVEGRPDNIFYYIAGYSPRISENEITIPNETLTY